MGLSHTDARLGELRPVRRPGHLVGGIARHAARRRRSSAGDRPHGGHLGYGGRIVGGGTGNQGHFPRRAARPALGSGRDRHRQRRGSHDGDLAAARRLGLLRRARRKSGSLARGLVLPAGSALRSLVGDAHRGQYHRQRGGGHALAGGTQAALRTGPVLRPLQPPAGRADHDRTDRLRRALDSTPILARHLSRPAAGLDRTTG